MKNAVDIEQMLGMTVGQIQDLSKAQKLIQNVVDQQTESIRHAIENNQVDPRTAQDILDNLNKMEVKNNGIRRN